MQCVCGANKASVKGTMGKHWSKHFFSSRKFGGSRLVLYNTHTHTQLVVSSCHFYKYLQIKFNIVECMFGQVGVKDGGAHSATICGRRIKSVRGKEGSRGLPFIKNP